MKNDAPKIAVRVQLQLVLFLSYFSPVHNESTCRPKIAQCTYTVNISFQDVSNITSYTDTTIISSEGKRSGEYM